MPTRYLDLITFLVLFCFVAVIPVQAQTCPGSAGCLDTTFGSGGTTFVNFSFIVPAPEGMAIQSDGKIVSVSGGHGNGHRLVRLNPDGSLDPSFGGDGIVEFTWSLVSGSTTYYGKAYGLAIQNIAGQERIVVAGAGNLQSGRKVLSSVLQLQRFMPDGSVDSSFGSNGTVIHNTDAALTVAVQADGKIVTVGGKLVRLNINGSLDNTFGTGGIVTAGDGRALAIDATGGIHVGGTITIGNGNNKRNIMSVKRYLSNGILDSSFGTAGQVTADFGINSQVFELQTDLAGNLVASGQTTTSQAIARFMPSGQPDLSFNGTGRATGPAGSGRGLALQSDGKAIVTGTFNNDFRLTRFNPNGTLDTTFGNGGVVTLNVFNNDWTIRTRIQIDPACLCEKIVLSGGSNPQITFARFHTF